MISWEVLKFIRVIYNTSQLTFLLLDSWPWLEGSHELGLAVLPSGSFFGIDSLVFSGNQYGVRAPYGVVYVILLHHLKIAFCLKMGKIDQKWAKNKVFWIYWEIYSLVFVKTWSIIKIIFYMLYSCTNYISDLEKSGFWDIDQYAFGQSDCKIFQSIISLE